MFAPSIQNTFEQALQRHRAGRLAESERLYRQILAQHPTHVGALHYLGVIAHQAGRNDIAEDLIRRAIALAPNEADAYHDLGVALADEGRFDEAIAAWRHAVVLRGDFAEAHSNLIFAMLRHPGFGPREIAEELGRWNRHHAETLRGALQRPSISFPNDPAPDRRLRVGYVSPDFVDHVVGRNLLPLFRRHDHRQFEITCYAQASGADAMTAAFLKYADHWRDIVGISDEQVARQIREDKIDLLVDLALHTAHNRLLVFARKPAPVQVTFAGYPGSTGLSAIDYRLSDTYLDPTGMDESIYSERTVRLPGSFWCYDPLDAADIPVNSLPVSARGIITFGCLNNFAKVNDDVLALWARVLGQVPGSRLLLLKPPEGHRQRMLARLRQEGIDPHRIEFIPHQFRRQYLELYHRIDLGLDSYPYNGHTTSLDSFWMGVPVVTLAGKTTVSRAGFSQVSNLGLTELAAQTAEQFVSIAVQLASDLPRLKDLRASLRRRMELSPLMDASRFTTSVENAYRQMWRRWCERSSIHNGRQ